MHPSLTVYDNGLFQYINPDFEIRVLDSTCRFAEGPVWNKEGFYLFSDIPQNVICKISEGKSKEMYLEQSGCGPDNTRALSEQIGSNGLAYDAVGNLLICQHGNGALAVYDGTSIKPYIDSFNGKPFNSPNDVVVHGSGAVFFSDPPYGLKDQKLDGRLYQPVAGFYRWQNNQVQLITDRYHYPNGVCLSPNGESLYTCSNKPFEAFVLEWDVETLQSKRQVAAESGDGIKCDRFGNLYLCNKDGLLILDSNGKRMGLIALETVPANCCWGGRHGRDLLVTARQHLFLIPDLQKA
jgi:gluconolactonase